MGLISTLEFNGQNVASLYLRHGEVLWEVTGGDCLHREIWFGCRMLGIVQGVIFSGNREALGLVNGKGGFGGSVYW